MINSSNDMMLTIDPLTRKILDSNIHGCESLGYSYQEILTLNIDDVDLEISDEKSWDSLIANIRNTKSMICNSKQKHKNGAILPVEININHVVVDNVEYLLMLMSDITERKKSEEIIIKQARYDSLTELPNRNFFYESIKKSIKKRP